MPVYAYRPNCPAWLKMVAALFDTISQIMFTQTNVRNDKDVKDYFKGVPIRKALKTDWFFFSTITLPFDFIQAKMRWSMMSLSLNSIKLLTIQVHNLWPVIRGTKSVNSFSFLAMIVYRVFRHENKFLVKLVHFGLQVVAFAIAIWGLKAVFDFHNHNNIPNLYSLHSWCGLTTVTLFGFQVSDPALLQWLWGFFV